MTPNQITSEEFSAAFDKCSALREAIEMRLNQRFYVEAIFVSHDDEYAAFVAVYDLEETYHDFSSYAEMMKFCKTCDAKYYKFDQVEKFRAFTFNLITRELTDISV